jgi:transposase-like protein
MPASIRCSSNRSWADRISQATLRARSMTPGHGCCHSCQRSRKRATHASDGSSRCASRACGCCSSNDVEIRLDHLIYTLAHPMPHRLCPNCQIQGRLLEGPTQNAWVEYWRCDQCGHIWTHDKTNPNSPHVDVTVRKENKEKAAFGRKPRKDRGVPRSPRSRLLRTPSYRRVTPEEVARYQRLARNGRSARATARRYGRSHATVNRWLAWEQANGHPLVGSTPRWSPP